MFNIHASSGKRAMKSVMERLSEFENRPLVLSVTALTSFSEDEFKEIYSCDILNKAKEFAIQSYESGLDGVVSSALESKAIKENTDENFLTLCPGIRPFKEQNDDQQRVVDIDEAKKLRVDFAVVGRPIYRAKKPKEIVERILSDIEKS
jgi:orotidine-5'-phosphate decarboxylase